MSKKIVIILGHPDSHSYCNKLAETYANSAAEIGHTVKLFKLGEMEFDPVLHHGYQKRQELEPCLREIQEAISWANHLVFIYPQWWGSMPALLKGFFDRTLLPGYAFKYRENSPFWDKLLTGRSAQAIVTMDTPPWYNWLVNRSSGHRQIKKTILEFCGIQPVKITSLGSIRSASPAQLTKWVEQIAKDARLA